MDVYWQEFNKCINKFGTSTLGTIETNPAIAYRPSEKDIGEYERLGPYFLVYNGMRGKSQSDVHAAMQSVNNIFTLGNFVPKLHIVVQCIDNVTDPFTSGSSVI